MMRQFRFFFNDTATTEIYPLSRHDALPILHNRGIEDVSRARRVVTLRAEQQAAGCVAHETPVALDALHRHRAAPAADRKSTRLNSSHANISYAVFCLKKKSTPADGRLYPCH